MHRARWLPLATVVPALFVSLTVCADGLIIGKVYDPYVQPLEKELEFRSLIQSDDSGGDARKYSLGFGRSLGERWFGEVYASGSKARDDTLGIDTFEIELKRQLTEQGEFALDWGLLFELERETDVNIWEAKTSLLVARQLGRWVATANLDLIYEWGGPIVDEFETAAHLQFRYRKSEVFEPAIEMHIGQETLAMGPVILGLKRFSGGSQMRWEFGYFAGLDEATPDHSLRLNFEYEFR